LSQIRPERAFAGEDVVIEGSSFGVNPGEVSVMLGDMQCVRIAVLEVHKTIRCTVGQSEGFNKTVVVTVNGLEGDNRTNVRFAYRKGGCTSAGSFVS
jgi:hypothetical protein